MSKDKKEDVDELVLSVSQLGIRESLGSGKPAEILEKIKEYLQQEKTLGKHTEHHGLLLELQHILEQQQ